MRTAWSKVAAWIVAPVILGLFCTRHERLGFAVFCLALIPTYYVFIRAGKHLYDD